MIHALLMAAAMTGTQADPVCQGVRVEDAVAHYAALTKAMNVHALAALYGEDGVLIGRSGVPITGAVAIEKFFAGFTGVTIEEQAMPVAMVSPIDGGWRVEGDYLQRATAPDGPHLAKGSYRADWRCGAAGWQLARMVFTPRTF
ncbi:MAG: DUF4440 domain-containing protein [Sphingomonas sp.]